MSHWTPVIAATEIPANGGAEVVVAGRVLAVYIVEGRPFVLDGVCPHQGGPLGKGRLEGCVVMCPWHGWQFDVRDGKHQINEALRHATYEARIEGDQVLVLLPDPPTTGGS